MFAKKFSLQAIQLSKFEKQVIGGTFLLLAGLAVVIFVQNYVKYASTAAYFSVRLSLLYNFIVFSTYTIFTPIIIKMAVQFPVGKESSRSNFLIHFGLSIVLGLAHMIFCNLVLYGLDLSSTPIFPRFITKYLTNVIHFHILAYWIILMLVSKRGKMASYNEATLDRFVIKQNKHTSFVELDQVYWIEALDHYQKLHTSDGFFIYNDSMANLVRLLPSEKFKRVHRSTIVNLSIIDALKRSEKQLSISLKNGHELPVGKSFKSEVRALFS